MPKNDSLKSVENIVQLSTTRRPEPSANSHVPRPQSARPVHFESWVTVRDRAAALLLGGNRRLLLVGPAGTGKTVLIEYVARVLRAAGRAVVIQLADADPAPPGSGSTLFVDEADRLSPTKLRRLFDEAAGTVVLVGLAPLVDRVAAGTAQLRLEPLGQTGARDYITQWLALNGRTPAELDSKAVRALAELSGGVPRLLSTLLAAGSWLASSSGARVIEAAHIHEAAELRSVLGSPAAPASPAAVRPTVWRSRVLWSAAAFALVGIAAAIMPRLFPAETGQAVERVSPLVDQAVRWLRAEPAPHQAPVAAPLPVARILPPIEQAAVPEPAKPVANPPPPEATEAAPEPLPAVNPEIVASGVAATPPPLAPEIVEFLLRRGRDMLALDDLSAARLLFERAADGGSTAAMIALGQTYDPTVRPDLGAGQADRAEALRWYRRAAAGGDHAAERLLPRP